MCLFYTCVANAYAHDVAVLYARSQDVALLTLLPTESPFSTEMQAEYRGSTDALFRMLMLMRYAFDMLVVWQQLCTRKVSGSGLRSD